MRLQPHMVTGSVGIGDRLQNPVDTDADQMQQFADHHGNLGGIDAVRAENGTAAAFGALVGVHEPLFEHADGHLSGAGHFTQNLARQGEIVTVNGTQQLGPHDRHIFGITGAKEEMAFIGTGTATYAAVHENLQRAKFFQPLSQTVDNNLFPVFGKFPVIIFRRPLPGIGKGQSFLAVEILYFIFLGRIGIIPGLENHRDVHPFPGRYCSSCHGWSLYDAFG